MPDANPVINYQWLNKAYQWGIQTCNAPNIGYSQAYRNQQTVNGITYYDCSSFVWYCLKNGGFPSEDLGTYPFVTYSYSEPKILEKLGWTRLNASTEKWLAGDILLGNYGTHGGTTDYQHTEMVYKGTDTTGQGYTMGAHGANGLALENQVSINTYLSYSSKYPVLYRYGAGGAEGYGLTMEQVAGMAGNAWYESTINPSAKGVSIPQDHGYGLFMWTDWTGENPFFIGQAMKDWMQEQGYETWEDGDGQVLCALADDLSTGTMWTPTPIPEYSYTNALYPDMQSWIESDDKDDVEEMCLEWFLHWESPNSLDIFNSTWAMRRDYAQRFYEYIKEHANDDSITEWIYNDESNFLTLEQSYNNAVMMYRIASAGGGGGGRKTQRKKMPIMMMLRKRRWY